MRRLIVFALIVAICWGYQALNERLDRIVDRVAGSQSVIPPEELDELWNDYKALHGGAVQNEEESKKDFTTNVNYIIDHNRQYKSGVFTFKLGVHEYSHLSHEEFNRVMNGFRRPATKRQGIQYQRLSGEVSGNFKKSLLEASGLVVDWRKRNAVTSVKNQGMCGSCYSFSAAGALEGMYALSSHNLTDFSEQQLVDCTYGWGNHGCNGGLMDFCFTYVQEVEGILSDHDYPYDAMETECRFLAKKAVTSCDGFVDLPEGDDHALLEAVYFVGPISIALDAGSPKFMSYKEGIFNDTECSPDNLNHGVLLIGYGTEIINNRPHPYWLVKNSWGESWGDRGYIKMSRSMPNICGISSFPSYPVLNGHRRRLAAEWK